MKENSKRNSIVRASVKLLAVIVLVPLFCVLMMFFSFGVVPNIMLRVHDFDDAGWSEGDTSRYYMYSDVSDFLDDQPTRDQVFDKLGAPDFYYICSHSCWGLGSPMGFSAYYLEVEFDASGRVVTHELQSH